MHTIVSSADYIYGRHPVSEIMRSRPREVRQLFLVSGRNERLDDIVRSAKRLSIPVMTVPERKLVGMVGDVLHQGIVAQVAAFAYRDSDELLLAAKERGEAPLLIMLDQIQDPHNLGALIRSAVALGAHGLIIPKDHSCEVNATVVKASAGATAYLGIARVTNLRRSLEELKSSGLWIVGADAGASCAVWDADFMRPSVIVIGSEGHGLRRLVADSCDVLVHIPMGGRLESLNASVAGGVLLYEASRQRRGGSNVAKTNVDKTNVDMTNAAKMNASKA
jgi:23S rRNA (guanosine2251-2'-O)-methyltransferase